MAKFAFTPEERDELAEEFGRVLFIQTALRTPNNVNPLGWVRRRLARGIVEQLCVPLETMIEYKINGVPEHISRKNK